MLQERGYKEGGMREAKRAAVTTSKNVTRCDAMLCYAMLGYYLPVCDAVAWTIPACLQYLGYVT